MSIRIYFGEGVDLLLLSIKNYENEVMMCRRMAVLLTESRNKVLTNVTKIKLELLKNCSTVVDDVIAVVCTENP